MGVDFGLHLGEHTRVSLRTAEGKTLASEMIPAPSIPPTFEIHDGGDIAAQAAQQALSGNAKKNPYSQGSARHFAYEWGWLKAGTEASAA